MIIRPTISCSLWLELVYTECCQDVILHMAVIGLTTQHLFFYFLHKDSCTKRKSMEPRNLDNIFEAKITYLIIAVAGTVVRICRWSLIIIYLILMYFYEVFFRIILAFAVKMSGIPYLCVLFTLLFPKVAICDEFDIIVRKLEQLEKTQKHEMRQMRRELDNLNQELTSTRAKLDLMKHSAVQSKNLFFLKLRTR